MPNGAASRRPASVTEANAPTSPPAPIAAVRKPTQVPTGMEQAEGDDHDQDVERASQKGWAEKSPTRSRGRVLRDDAKTSEQLFG